MGESSGLPGRRERPGIPYATSSAQQQLPPAYSTISYDQETSMTLTAPSIVVNPRHNETNNSQRRHTTTHFPIAHNHSITISSSEKPPSASACHTMPRLPSARHTINPTATVQRILTAQDVAQLLRPSASLLHSPFQRNQEGRRNTLHMHHRSTSTPNSSLTATAVGSNDGILARSVDDLVTNVALVGESEAAAVAAVLMAQSTNSNRS